MASAESTKELTAEGARVVTTAAGADATAPPPPEPDADVDDDEARAAEEAALFELLATSPVPTARRMSKPEAEILEIPGLVLSDTFHVGGTSVAAVQAFLFDPASWPALTPGYEGREATRIDAASFRCASADGPQGVQWMWVYDQKASDPGAAGEKTLDWRVALTAPGDAEASRPSEPIFSVSQTWALAPDAGGVKITRTVADFAGPDEVKALLQGQMLPQENAKLVELLAAA